MEPTIPPPRLTARALAVLKVIEDAGGEIEASYDLFAARAQLARSTAQLAVADLRSAGAITVEERPGKATRYTVGTLPTSEVGTLPTLPTRYPTDPTDQPSVDAPAPAHAAATRPGGSPPLTPIPAESGTPIPGEASRVGEPAPAHEEPGTVGTPRPIGSLAVAEAMQAAKAAGISIEPALRARIGNAAQQLAKDETVETILAAARRLGEGGFTDLYTAVRAVERGAPPPTVFSPAPVPGAGVSKLADVFRALRSTWPRIVIDVPFWEEKLEKIPERFLLAAVDRLAKDEGGEFPPHWGQVYKTAWRIGVDETERRRSAAERADLRARVRAIEES